jgi:hypothetical protein
MDRELKIVVSIFLIFLIYGLTALFSGGSFATPVFINQLVLLLISVVFYVMNMKEKGAVILLFFSVLQLFMTIIDDFTVGYLSQKLELNFLYELSSSLGFNLIVMLVYFGFYYFLAGYAFKTHQSKSLLVLKIMLLSSAIGLFFIPHLSLFRDLSFFAFILLFVISVNRFSREENKVLSVVSYQMLLLFLLEGMEYFL